MSVQTSGFADVLCQIEQICVIFTDFKVVGRCSETHRRVVENLNDLI